MYWIICLNWILTLLNWRENYWLPCLLNHWFFDLLTCSVRASWKFCTTRLVFSVESDLKNLCPYSQWMQHSMLLMPACTEGRRWSHRFSTHKTRLKQMLICAPYHYYQLCWVLVLLGVLGLCNVDGIWSRKSSRRGVGKNRCPGKAGC